MRITNSIIANNTVKNVNTNKLTLDSLYTQLSTGKVIQRASEDPIVAIRALRFRTELSELKQYLKKNIPDARSWMQLTEDALDSVSSMVSTMVTYMDQGATGTLDAEAKMNIVKTMKQYREQIHEDANATYSGRSIFTGYKTNTTMIFPNTDTTIRYDITEKFSSKDLDQVVTIARSVDASVVGKITDDKMPERYYTYRLRLSYDKVEANTKIKYTDAQGKEDKKIATEIIYTDAQGNENNKIAVEKLICEDGKYYKVDADGNMSGGAFDPYKDMAEDTSTETKAYLIADTGEIIMNKTAYTTLYDATAIRTAYTKIGFEKGELRPEHYFSCTSTTNDGVKKVTEYSDDRQDINYTVNFNQVMKVNTEGRDVFKHSVIRDIDELVDITQKALNAEEKVMKLENMKKDSAYEHQQDEIDSMLAAAKKELDLVQDTLKSMYGSGITAFSTYEKIVTAQISDIGARSTRLSLNETRLSNQSVSLEELKSINEDADKAETMVNLTTAQTTYQASLSAASKLLSTSLLDYI